jgi:hypothetical protein
MVLSKILILCLENLIVAALRHRKVRALIILGEAENFAKRNKVQRLFMNRGQK